MSYLYTSVFCCAVGYVAWFAVAAATLGQAMIVSFSIGLSINTASVVLRKVIQSYVGFFPSAVLITLLGLVVGLVIGGTLALNDPMGLFTQNSQALLVSGVFGCIGYAVVSTREVLLRTQVKLAEVQLATEVQEKLLARAELRRLQAQIEPHFLFNTLTSVAALIRHDHKLLSTCWRTLRSCYAPYLIAPAQRKQRWRQSLRLLMPIWQSNQCACQSGLAILSSMTLR